MRVLIVDVTHIFYKMQYGNPANLTATVMVPNGAGGFTQQVVPTKLIDGVVKTIVRWSDYGNNPTVVCFDSRGCGRSRKTYFAQGSKEVGAGYKGTRVSQNDEFYTSINWTAKLLNQGGIAVLSHEKYEADDLVKAAVDRAKELYPNTPIDVVTGDQDLLPLVDEQVSVFLTSRKYTWAESKDLEKRHYVQVTPANYESIVEDLTEFKNLSVPYNCVLLKKLLRGKKADNIAGYPKFTPTKFNNLVEDMIRDGVDIKNLFRYDTAQPIPQDIRTGLDISEEYFNSLSDEEKTRFVKYRYNEPAKLTEICQVLGKYLEPEVIEHIRFVYNGVNLNGAFTGLPDGYNRMPARVKAEIKPYEWGKLQQAVSILKIHLPYPK